MISHKITLKLAPSFALGFTLMAPKWNGFCLELHVAYFTLSLWNRGEGLFTFQNYWNG